MAKETDHCHWSCSDNKITSVHFPFQLTISFNKIEVFIPKSVLKRAFLDMNLDKWNSRHT